MGLRHGSLARQPMIASYARGGRRRSRPAVSGSSYTVRYRTAAASPEPNGRRPVAAYASTQPREKTSLGGPTSPVRAWACSGER